VRARRTLVVACLIAVPVSCTAASTPATQAGSAPISERPQKTTQQTTTPAPTGSHSASSPATTPPSVATSPASSLPLGLPASFASDVPSADVPAVALVPKHTDVTGAWYGRTSSGEAIVVAWQVPGSDPFAHARGLAVWRRFDDGGAPWRPVYGTSYPKTAGVLGISAVTGDLTGDGSDDVLVFAETGGSGGCGTYAVVDLASAARLFRRSVCDTRIDPSTDPPGLVVLEAVYEKGDPHCCPSAMRTSVLTYADDLTWTTRSSAESPTSYG
jgi:hypothetical protein